MGKEKMDNQIMENLERRIENLTKEAENIMDYIFDNWGSFSERQQRKLIRLRNGIVSIINDESEGYPEEYIN